MKSRTFLAYLFMGLFIAGCAQKAVENNLSAKMAEEPNVSGALELQLDAGFLIEKSNLTSEQKKKLRTLQASTVKQQAQLREESLKLRSILIKDTLSSNYNKSEVLMIQNRIEKVEHRRVALTFETLDKANGILGRETHAEENVRLLDQMMMNREMH